MSKNPVPWRIECRSYGPRWEVIAAFDSEFIALGYAKDCVLSSPQNFYRVRYRGQVIHEMLRLGKRLKTPK